VLLESWPELVKMGKHLILQPHLIYHYADESASAAHSVGTRRQGGCSRSIQSDIRSAEQTEGAAAV